MVAAIYASKHLAIPLNDPDQFFARNGFSYSKF